MFYKFKLIISVVILSTFSAFSQARVEKLIAFNDIRGKDKNVLSELGVKDICLVHGHELFPSTLNGKLNISKIKNMISSDLPNSNSSGIIVLDWEGEWIKVLNGTKKVSESQFNVVLRTYISLIKEVKKFRPNALVSYYGIPFRSTVVNQNKLLNSNNKVSLLFKEMDFLSPSLYFFNQNTSLDQVKSFNTKYVNDNMVVFQKIKNDVKKPLYIFVWNRWHTNSKFKKQELINIPEYDSLLSQIEKRLGSNDKIIVYLNDYTVFRFKPNVHKIDMSNTRKARTAINSSRSSISPKEYQTNILKSYLNSKN